jgi:hypothetical protein
VQLEAGLAVVAPAGKIDDLGALGCRLGGLDRLHDVEPVLVKKTSFGVHHSVCSTNVDIVASFARAA